MEDTVTGDWEVQSDDETLSDDDQDDLRLEVAPTSARQHEPVHRDIPQPGLTPTSATLAENAYFGAIEEGSGLQLTMEASIRNAYEKDGVYGLFSLFVTSTLRQSIRGWTTAKLEAKGKKAVSESEINACIGLEMAMSLCLLNDIADYWSKDRVFGQPAFIETMSRDRFQHIRAALQLHPPSLVTFATVRDPLYPLHEPCCNTFRSASQRQPYR